MLPQYHSYTKHQIKTTRTWLYVWLIQVNGKLPYLKGKTVQQIQPLTGQVHVNRITVEQKEIDSTPDTILTHKNNMTTTGIVMPGDYSPHQEYELEDAEVAPETRK